MGISKHLYSVLGLANQFVNKIETKLERDQLLSYPVDIDVVLTKACNFACTFCKDYETPTGAKRISLDNFTTLAEQVFPTARNLNICSGGEPYLHNKLIDILKIAKKYSLRTWVLSNGSIFIPEKMEQIVSEGLIDSHGFSVDGYKATTVESIRIRGKHEVILNSIRSLINMRSELKKKKPKIVIRYALMRRNIEELVDAIHLWGNLGIDVLDCGLLSLANSVDRNELLFYHQALLERTLDEARKVSQMYPNMVVNLPESIAIERQKAKVDCKSPWSFLMVDTNGELMPCYRSFEALRFQSVYQGKRFKDIWNSENYKKLRRSANNDEVEFFPYCNECEIRCGWGDERVHLGDETWKDVVKDWLPKEKIDHKRSLKGGYKIDAYSPNKR